MKLHEILIETMRANSADPAQAFPTPTAAGDLLLLLRSICTRENSPTLAHMEMERPFGPLALDFDLWNASLFRKKHMIRVGLLCFSPSFHSRFDRACFFW
jgi:hypothetical protein